MDRLARSAPFACQIVGSSILRGVKPALGGSFYDPGDPMGKMFFNIPANFAEIEADLIQLRTRAGVAIARAKGKLRGKQPKLSDTQQKELKRMRDASDHSISDLPDCCLSQGPPSAARWRAKTTPNNAGNPCHLALKFTGL